MAVNKIDRQVWEVLELVRKARTKEEKIKILKQNDHWAIRDILLVPSFKSILIDSALPPCSENIMLITVII